MQVLVLLQVAPLRAVGLLLHAGEEGGGLLLALCAAKGQGAA